MGFDGTQQYDRTGSISLYSKEQYGFWNQYGGNSADDSINDMRFLNFDERQRERCIQSMKII